LKATFSPREQERIERKPTQNAEAYLFVSPSGASIFLIGRIGGIEELVRARKPSTRS